MLKLLLTGAVAVGALVAVSAATQAADPYTFALVPKNTNNPFFDQALASPPIRFAPPITAAEIASNS